MYKPGTCNMCGRYAEIAEIFKKNKIVITKAKKKD